MKISERIKNVIRGMGSILNPDPLPEWEDAPEADMEAFCRAKAKARAQLMREAAQRDLTAKEDDV